MSKLRICQFATGFHPGDAISNEMLTFHKYFLKLGYESLIYAEHIGTEYKKYSGKFKNYKSNKSDVIVYHHSIHSNVLDFILEKPCKKILIYHNITPSYFFEPYDLPFSYLLNQGKIELKNLNLRFDRVLADSEFNRKELNNLGYKNVEVLPILYDFSVLEEEAIFRNIYDGVKITFVGRISPNKKQCDLIRLAEIYRKYFRKNFQIQLVGYESPASKPYLEELKHLVKFFNLEDHVHFSGYVTQGELNGYYESSDVFLSMSEHEGFCVPLLEAMYFRIPVLAYSAGAVEDTLDGAGILFEEKNFPRICETIEEILTNTEFRDSIILGQDMRINSYKNSIKEEILLKAIQTNES